MLWTTWWWESDFELRRSYPAESPSIRESNTLLSLLESRPQVEKRILINRFWGENLDWTQYINTDAQLRTYAEEAQDNFEIILQGNTESVPITGIYPTPDIRYSFLNRLQEQERFSAVEFIQIADGELCSDTLEAASWHQKAMVFDDIAYVGGFNSRQGDWDQAKHAIFDPLRMSFDASQEERDAVYSKQSLPDYEPRRDYGVRIEGPLVGDIEQVLATRWKDSIDSSLLYAENATSFTPQARDEVPSGVMAQLVVTLPPPHIEVSLLETHLKAISQAESYILIEDQYFRAPIINDAIVARMREKTELVLIVVTMEVDTLDPALQYTYESHVAFLEEFPDRYLPLQLRTSDLYTEEGVFYDDVEFTDIPIFIHSKLRIIDDIYLSVGSGNMNNRGYKFEGEMNVSILDASFVEEQRRTIFHHLVGVDYHPYLSDDPKENFETLRVAANYNQLIVDWWYANASDLSAQEAEQEWAWYRPSGYVYPLDFSSDYFAIAGPDLF